MSVLQCTSVKIVSADVIDLITADGECWGAWALTRDGRLMMIHARSTVLATGGGAGIFIDHLVSDGEIGAGYALAQRAGAALDNLEFIQFMLGLKKEKKRLFLPLSDLHKPGVLVDLDGRDLLEKQIADIQLRHKTIEERKKHFPFSCRDSSCLVDLAIAKERRNGGKVFWKDDSMLKVKSEVVHFSHAFNGGIKINEKAESTLPGLFAAGESAAGPHGADRIGGCMMTATQVFGQRAGYFSAIRAKNISMLPNKIEIPEHVEKSVRWKGPELKDQESIEIVEQAREKFSWELMVVRTENGLMECLTSFKSLIGSLKEIEAKNDQIYFEFRNILLVGKLIALQAMNRKKSLGSHYLDNF